VLSKLEQEFKVTRDIVATIPGTELDNGTSQERYRAWRAWLREHGVRYPKEFLVPRVVVDIEPRWPEWMTVRPDIEASPRELLDQALAIGPWEEPFRLGEKAITNGSQEAIDRILYRRELIIGTVARLFSEGLSDSTVLDIGCHNGFFSFDIAARGAKQVDGVDLRDVNINQAKFLADVYGVENVAFTCSDFNALPVEQWDIVLNLGVLYHVTDPLEFMRQTYDVTGRVAVIDTVCDPDPLSAFIFLGDKNVGHAAEGRDVMELHATYRATIELIRRVGFRDIIEVTANAEWQHPFYEGGMRRCFLAFK
jgi:SAM-dependent methyltransferase